MKSDRNSTRTPTEENTNHIKKTIIIDRNKDQTGLSDAIREEIASFQKHCSSIGLYQSALIFDCKETKEPQEIFEECTDSLNQHAPGWTIQKLTRENWNGPSAIFNLVSKSNIIRAIAQAGLFKIPALKSSIFGFSGFLFTILLFFAVLILQGNWRQSAPAGVVFSAFSCAAIIGYILYRIAQNQVLSKYPITSSAIEILRQPDNRKLYGKCLSMAANSVCSNLPMVIMIEDLSTLDNLSSDILKSIILSEETSCTGAIMWLAFNSTIESTGDIFNDCRFPVKRYVIS
jgi:hypothetical protein